MTKKNDTTEVLTLPGLAAKVGRHRTSLLRLEQKGIISRAPTYQGVRVYDDAMVKKVEAELQAHEGARRTGKHGKIVVPTSKIVHD